MVDALHETAVRFCAQAPFSAPFRMIWWLRQSKAHLKERLCDVVALDPATLPWLDDVRRALIDDARKSGRTVILCTASDLSIARRVAEHLGCFDGVIASDGSRNMSGSAKAQELVDRYGEGGFDYIGNAKADLPVWARGREAIVVSSDSSLVREAKRIGNVSRVLPGVRPNRADWGRQLRLHQWVKNLLLFVPLLAAQCWADLGTLWTVAIGFLSFSIIASSTYILNDLFDIEADRQHAEKKSARWRWDASR